MLEEYTCTPPLPVPNETDLMKVSSLVRCPYFRLEPLLSSIEEEKGWTYI